MNTVPFSAEKHYDEICTWWLKHGWPQVPLDHLSDTGFVIEQDDGTPVCAGWLYLTGTAFAIFEWAVVNPCAEKSARKKALDQLIAFARHMAVSAGARTIFTSAQTKNAAWISRLARGGFTVTDSNMTNLTSRVGG